MDRRRSIRGNRPGIRLPWRYCLGGDGSARRPYRCWEEGGECESEGERTAAANQGAASGVPLIQLRGLARSHRTCSWCSAILVWRRRIRGSEEERGEDEHCQTGQFGGA